MQLKNITNTLMSLALLAIAFSCSTSTNDGGGNGGEGTPVYGLISDAGSIDVPAEYYYAPAGQVDSSALGYQETNTGFQRGYIVTTQYNVDMNENMFDYVLVNPWSSLYPGALIQGKSLNNNGVPVEIPIYSKRLPGIIVLDAVSGDTAAFYKETNMTKSEVTQAQNDLLAGIITSSETPAKTAYKLEKIYSYEQLARELGLSFSVWGSKIKTTYNMNLSQSSTKHYLLLKLYQEFFTMAYQCPDASVGIKGVFSDDITTDMLRDYTGANNPICYVSSVSYGRIYNLLYETTENIDTLYNALKITAFKHDQSLSEKQISVLRNTKVQMSQFGGNAGSGLDVAIASLNDTTKLNKFIRDGAKFGLNNVGAPISYKVNLLKDNSIVKIANTLKYTYSEQTFVPVAPEGLVYIDLFDIEALTPSIEGVGDRKVSNKQMIKINSVSIKTNEANTQKLFKISQYTMGQKVGAKYGHIFPIYDRYSIKFGSKDEMVGKVITIEVQGVIHHASIHETMGGSNLKDTDEPFTLTQQFQYNVQNNRWDAMNNGSSENIPFESLARSYSQVYVKQTIKLNYRFECDGYVHKNTR